ncbi:TRAP transporter small permease [Metabacillus arenae]|uniref:TRAP transporter small permease n=1 Tax=Metabacillus arenae TaxID=2771434 RepID=A0A926NNP7_9BACI|nr:TRAP transporter small permease [Metabacillus arenae]MBD1383273.1 TRAP transporter small permease [Metabacillus arenae]
MLKKWFNSIDDLLSLIALSGITVLTILNVFCRFILNNPIAWVEEVTLGLFVWLVFIGVSSAMKRDGHIGVDYFLKRMPKIFHILFTIIGSLSIYYVLVYVFIVLGLDLTSKASSKVTPVLAISYQWIDIAIPIGGILTTIHFTIKLLHSFQGDDEKGREI